MGNGVPHNLFVHFDCWSAEVWNKKLRKGFWLIWHASIWVIWKTRNDRIFMEISKGVEEIVDEIKFLSWQWSVSRLKTPSCLFYEWS